MSDFGNFNDDTNDFKDDSSINDLKSLARIVHYVDNHFEAGHDLDNVNLVIDLGTLLIDLHRVLDTLGAPATTDQRVAFLVRQAVTADIKLNTIIEFLEEDEDDYPI